MPLEEAASTCAVAFLFAAVFLFGGRVHAPVALLHRNAVSLGAGASIAYIFMQLLPELEGAGTLFREATSHLGLPFRGRYGLHLATMLGFTGFYGLEAMALPGHEGTDEAPGRAGRVFLARMAGYGSYAWVVSYLLVRSLAAEEGVSLPRYAAAMVLHFLLVAHSLREAHEEAYDRVGSRVLAACCVGGWICGLLLDLPRAAVVILFGIVAGGLVVNTMILELPSRHRGKFAAFLLGAVSYSALLVGFP